MIAGDLSDNNATGIDLMRTEISVGLTFATMASGAGTDTQKRDRNRVNAQKAYEAVLRFLPRLTLTAGESAELHGGLERLRLAIAAIPL